MSAVPRTKLAAAIAERTLGIETSTQLAQEIAAYLLDEGRTNELDSILRDVMQYRADRGLIEVVAINAFPLSDQVRRDITAVVRELYPQATRVIISEQLDRTVIGGVRLEFANEQLDLSVRARLNRFKQLTAAPGGN